MHFSLSVGIFMLIENVHTAFKVVKTPVKITGVYRYDCSSILK